MCVHRTTSEGFLTIAKRLEHMEKGKDVETLSEAEKKRPRSAAGYAKNVASLTDRARPLKDFKKQSLATKLSQTTGSRPGDGFQAEILVKGANGDIKRTHITPPMDEDIEKDEDVFMRPAMSPKLSTSPIRAMQQVTKQ